MLEFLRGIVDERTADVAVIDVAGVGYRVNVPGSTAAKLPVPGHPVKLFIVESFAMYGGSTSYYGFLSREERDLFQLLRDEVPGAGAKKALEYLDKVTRSLPDFVRAVAAKDAAALTAAFGFTRKTADKLVAALKDKIAVVGVAAAAASPAGPAARGSRAEAVAGLLALGYRETQAQAAVEKACADAPADLAVATLIRRALSHL